ncbi:MAG: murein transglycosylase A [Planctomycetota bacterium]|jgi:membrane-bound lytic murein transglycosylase A
MLRHLSLLVIICTVLLGGCRLRGSGDKDYDRPLAPGAVALEVVAPGDLPTFTVNAGERPALLSAVDHSLTYLGARSAAAKYPVAGISQQQVINGLERFRDLLASGADAATINQAIRTDFTVYRSIGWNGAGEVLFTGYYTPIFDGRTTPEGRFQHPLYRRPADLVSTPGSTGLAHQRLADGSTRPYPTRAEIDAQGGYPGKELVYLPSAIDAYIIQVQGSALLRLADGSMLEIGYAGTNGQPYLPIRDPLVRDGHIKLEDFNLATLRAWADANPDLVPRYLASNPRYVFFTEAPGGPFGSLGRPVTTNVSIATDKRIFPPGALCFVTTLADAGGTPAPYAAFRLDQDTGGAIQAPGRCDLFMGIGADAETRAGRQYHEGALYYLVAK